MWRIEFNDVCGQIVERMDGALGCALVDLATGLPLALDAKSDSLITTTALEMISAAAVACFSGGAGGQSGPDSGVNPGASRENAPLQIQVTTEFTYNFMSLVPGDDGVLLVLITTRGDSNLGLGWMAMRQALHHLSNLHDDRTLDLSGTAASTSQAGG